jgi:hypothetical protein
LHGEIVPTWHARRRAQIFFFDGMSVAVLKKEKVLATGSEFVTYNKSHQKKFSARL